MSEIRISTLEWKKILRKLSKLEALEIGGVHSWEWCDEALEPWRMENEIEDIEEEFLENILQIVGEDSEVDFPAGMEAGASVCVNQHGQERIVDMFKHFSEKIEGVRNE